MRKHLFVLATSAFIAGCAGIGGFGNNGNAQYAYQNGQQYAPPNGQYAGYSTYNERTPSRSPAVVDGTTAELTRLRQQMTQMQETIAKMRANSLDTRKLMVGMQESVSQNSQQIAQTQAYVAQVEQSANTTQAAGLDSAEVEALLTTYEGRFEAAARRIESLSDDLIQTVRDEVGEKITAAVNERFNSRSLRLRDVRSTRSDPATPAENVTGRTDKQYVANEQRTITTRNPADADRAEPKGWPGLTTPPNPSSRIRFAAPGKFVSRGPEPRGSLSAKDKPVTVVDPVEDYTQASIEMAQEAEALIANGALKNERVRKARVSNDRVVGLSLKSQRTPIEQVHEEPTKPETPAAQASKPRLIKTAAFQPSVGDPQYRVLMTFRDKQTADRIERMCEAFGLLDTWRVDRRDQQTIHFGSFSSLNNARRRASIVERKVRLRPMLQTMSGESVS